MSIERIIRIMAGFMVLLSVALAHFSGQFDLAQMTWFWLTLFIGLNLLQSGLTGFCPPVFLLRKLGFKEEGNCCS